MNNEKLNNNSRELSFIASVIFYYNIFLWAGIEFILSYICIETIHVFKPEENKEIYYIIGIMIGAIIGTIKGHIASIDYEYKSQHILFLSLIERNTRIKNEYQLKEFLSHIKK